MQESQLKQMEWLKLSNWVNRTFKVSRLINDFPKKKKKKLPLDSGSL